MTKVSTINIDRGFVLYLLCVANTYIAYEIHTGFGKLHCHAHHENGNSYAHTDLLFSNFQTRAYNNI